MVGLPESLQNLCRIVHRAFLNSHGLQSWPVKVTVEQSTPQEYYVAVACGSEADSYQHISTSSVDLDLPRILGRNLENHYEKTKKLDEASWR